MKTKSKLFDFVTAKRYYYLVAFKRDNFFSIKNFYNNCGFERSSHFHSSHEFNDFRIDHQRIISNEPFHIGDRDFSIENNGKPPYNYDLFVVEIKKLNILIFGFPFKLLALTITNKLINDYNLLLNGSFVKLNLDKLVKNYHNSDFITDFISVKFTGIEFTYIGDPKLSGVHLVGDNPLRSNLYKNVFVDLLNDNLCKIECCNLKCDTFKKEELDIPKTKSNMYVDLFGNFKIYLHGSGNNILTIPWIFDLFNENDCMITTLSNPINKLKDDQL